MSKPTPEGRTGARREPRVLYLTSHLPAPPVSGGRRREFELVKRLGRRCELELVAASKAYEDDLAHVSHLQDSCATIHVFPCEQRRPSPLHPFQLERHRSRDLSRYLRRRLDLGAVDLIHVEGFYMMQHVPDDIDVPVLLVEQNIEYDLWRQRADHEDDPGRRAAHLREYLLTLQEEIRAWRRAGRCAILTKEDRELMLREDPGLDVDLVPDGADHLVPHHPVRGASRRAGKRVIFIANFAYQPNEDAVRHLCRDIWPHVHNRHPDAQLWLVGNSPSPVVLAEAASAGAAVTGRVARTEPYLDAADVLVCPLRVGGGVKVKVLEGLVRGKPMVSTSVGVQGLPAEAANTMIVCDDPRAFAHAVIRLLEDPGERRRLGSAAAAVAKTLPTWDDSARALARIYESLIAGRHDGPREVVRTGA